MTTHQPIDKIILNSSGSITGYKNDNSSYSLKIDEPIWGKPTLDLSTYTSSIQNRKNTTITPNLTYKKLCNFVNNSPTNCLSSDSNAIESGYYESPLTTTPYANTTSTWAVDNEHLCNKDGFCALYVDGGVVLQSSKNNIKNQQWNLLLNNYSSTQICNKHNLQCLTSRYGFVSTQPNSGANEQLWKFTQ